MTNRAGVTKRALLTNRAGETKRALLTKRVSYRPVVRRVAPTLHVYQDDGVVEEEVFGSDFHRIWD